MWQKELPNKTGDWLWLSQFECGCPANYGTACVWQANTREDVEKLKSDRRDDVIYELNNRWFIICPNDKNLGNQIKDGKIYVDWWIELPAGEDC